MGHETIRQLANQFVSWRDAHAAGEIGDAQFATLTRDAWRELRQTRSLDTVRAILDHARTTLDDREHARAIRESGSTLVPMGRSSEDVLLRWLGLPSGDELRAELRGNPPKSTRRVHRVKQKPVAPVPAADLRGALYEQCKELHDRFPNDPKLAANAAAYMYIADGIGFDEANEAQAKALDSLERAYRSGFDAGVHYAQRCAEARAKQEQEG